MNCYPVDCFKCYVKNIFPKATFHSHKSHPHQGHFLLDAYIKKLQIGHSFIFSY
jgi:hypothetical protein